MEVQENPFEKPHNICDSVRNKKFDIQFKAEIKSRILIEMYMLRYYRAKFSQTKLSPICGEEEENIKLFFLNVKSSKTSEQSRRRDSKIC